MTQLLHLLITAEREGQARRALEELIEELDRWADAEDDQGNPVLPDELLDKVARARLWA